MATSHHFEADIFELSESQLEKLYAWGTSSCENFDVRMNGDMSMVLIATRKKAGTVRDHMRLLRTNLLNWGVSLPSKQVGWLRLVTDDGNSAEMDGAGKEAAQAASSAIQSVPQTSHRLVLPKNVLTIPVH